MRALALISLLALGLSACASKGAIHGAEQKADKVEQVFTGVVIDIRAAENLNPEKVWVHEPLISKMKTQDRTIKFLNVCAESVVEGTFLTMSKVPIRVTLSKFEDSVLEYKNPPEYVFVDCEKA